MPGSDIVSDTACSQAKVVLKCIGMHLGGYDYSQVEMLKSTAAVRPAMRACTTHVELKSEVVLVITPVSQKYNMHWQRLLFKLCAKLSFISWLSKLILQ